MIEEEIAKQVLLLLEEMRTPFFKLIKIFKGLEYDRRYKHK